MERMIEGEQRMEEKDGRVRGGGWKKKGMDRGKDDRGGLEVRMWK